MDTKTLAHPAQYGKTTRHDWGIVLGQERLEEIARIAPWTWSVASCSGETVYTVNLKGEGHCSCPDRPPAGERCKHETAARYVKAKTATCSGCRARFRHKALVDVYGGNGGTFREGELLCRPCARSHGAL